MFTVLLKLIINLMTLVIVPFVFVVGAAILYRVWTTTTDLVMSGAFSVGTAIGMFLAVFLIILLRNELLDILEPNLYYTKFL